MGFKLKIGKLKISAKNPVKAIVKAITAPIVAPTVAAVSVVNKKAAEDLGEKVGLNKDDVAGLKVGALTVASVAAPIILANAAAAVPAAAAAAEAAKKVEEAKKAAEEAAKKLELEKAAEAAAAAAKKLEAEKAAAEAAAKAALPPPAPALPPPAPASKVDTLFKDNAPAAPVQATVTASAAPRELDFLEKFFAWLASVL